MASRDIVVTVGEDDWLVLNDAAEGAGMSMEAYVSWGVRVLALQARSGAVEPDGREGSPDMPISASETAEDSEASAWVESFAERLSHRTYWYDEI
ncbi:hypothetical protein ACQP1O_20635 [Nocardia sp. CA-151230]|uniref:hypothetical protein n=1 Tax=Nocardia sp. CA-151230 TaxID=3239982 RepID=UPI003D948FBA